MRRPSVYDFSDLELRAMLAILERIVIDEVEDQVDAGYLGSYQAGRVVVEALRDKLVRVTDLVSPHQDTNTNLSEESTRQPKENTDVSE